MAIRQILTILVVTVLIITINVGQVKGTSMYPALNDNGTVFYTKYFATLDRFDKIVVKHDNEYLVKRLIGLPGDKLFLLKGKVIGVNDVYLPSFYISESDIAQIGVYVVPPNMYYYVGDNQPNSIDSRHTGPVSVKDIVGLVLMGW